MHRRKELAWRIKLVPCSCFVIETLRSKNGWVIHSLSDLQLCCICGQFAQFWFHANIVQWFRTRLFSSLFLHRHPWRADLSLLPALGSAAPAWLSWAPLTKSSPFLEHFLWSISAPDPVWTYFLVCNILSHLQCHCSLTAVSAVRFPGSHSQSSTQ